VSWEGCFSAASMGSYVVSAMSDARREKYSGRPGTMPLSTFEDRQEAGFERVALKIDKKIKFTKADYLRQLAEHLDDEALQVWRKHKDRILT
jgi:hypothetical protein